MTTVDDAPRTFNLRAAVRSVRFLSLLALIFSAYRIFTVLSEMFDRLAHRASGVSYTWNPDLPAPQPAHGHFSAQGSTAYFTAMTGTVKNLPIAAIVFPSVGQLVSVITTAGVAICILVLCRRVAAGAPFAPASARALTWLAAVVFVGFEAATIVTGLGKGAVTNVLMGAPSSPDGTFVASGDSYTLFTFWPLYVSLALLALATVFRVGGRYQADSQGLV